jgi:hypothetical protein|eukprot:COSAG01_NODE_10743_length_2090_cov_189.674535_3_plen_88_part_00
MGPFDGPRTALWKSLNAEKSCSAEHSIAKNENLVTVEKLNLAVPVRCDPQFRYRSDRRCKGYSSQTDTIWGGEAAAYAPHRLDSFPV